MPPVLHGTGESRKPCWERPFDSRSGGLFDFRSGQGAKVELADVFRLHGEAYRRSHGLPLSYLKVMRAIESCRTAALGGHLEECDSCGFSRPVYNSCRNRHCPKCQSLAKAQWLEDRQAELLPVPYFHLVFTLPHELNVLALANKWTVYALLFQAASETLLEFGRNELGGTLGITAILHTWDQTLGEHLHLHCALPGGALSANGQRWIPARDNFLFPVKALSVVFRGKFLAGLKKAKGRLRATEDIDSLVSRLYRPHWMVYAKRAFAGPQAVLDYFGRYTHRIALSNERLLDVKEDAVSFSYRDRRDDNRKKVMTLSPEEFIRRFLLHVVPLSFVRIRHFGFLANRRKKKDLERCRELLGVAPTEIPGAVQAADEPSLNSSSEASERLDTCPVCAKGHMRLTKEIPPEPLPLWPIVRRRRDSS